MDSMITCNFVFNFLVDLLDMMYGRHQRNDKIFMLRTKKLILYTVMIISKNYFGKLIVFAVSHTCEIINFMNCLNH